MEYRSPNPEVFRTSADRLTETLKNAASFDEADGAFREFESLCSGFDTACSICMVRHELNTLDKYYDAEFERIDEISPKIEEKIQEFRKALVESPFRNDFDERYGSLLISDMELSLKT
ncbi:MAG: M3 family oligoendopeptidase, partial [Clostridia bacterium]|nr:M3 family oligoendopeptidase [Clostridia bacterium]